MRLKSPVMTLLLLVASLATAAPDGKLSGTVGDDKGAPLPGVLVDVQSSAADGSPPRTATTDAGGRFEVAGLPAGTYRVSATLSGLPPTKRDGVVLAEGGHVKLRITINVSALSETLTEVDVTARRVTETVQQAPVTVTAIPSAVVEANRVDTLDQFVELVPNATVPDDAFGTKQVVNIRGVTSPDTTAEPGLGLFRNGQYYGGIITNLGSMVDIERVEVMRGPQGGLYGRNALGGAMNVVVATPKGETDFGADVRYGSYGRLDASAVANVPIVEGKLLARLVGWSFGQPEGEHYNSYLQQEMDDRSDRGGRLGLTWIPTEKVTVHWMAEGQKLSGPENTLFIPARGETKETIERDTPSTNDQEALFISQDIVWDTRAGELTLALSHRSNSQDTLSDQDFSTVQPSDYPFALKQDIRRDVDSSNDFAELRWASPRERKLTWIAGVSYYREDLDFNRLIDTLIDLSLIGYGPGVSGGRGNILTTIETRSTSAFAEATWALAPKLSLLASLRYTSDKKDLAYDQFVTSDDPIIPILFAGLLPTISTRDNTTFDNWSPGVGLDWRIDQDRSVYARVTTGFRAGGYNTVVSDPDLLPYDAETSINYEVGLKSEWLQRRMRVNLALFRFDQQDLALRRQDPGDPSGTFTYLENAGEARTYGVELEFAARLARGFDLMLSYGWLDAKLTEALLYNGPNQPLLDLEGARVLDTPDYTATLMALYDRPLSARTNLLLNASYRLRSDLLLDYSGSAKADAYKLLSVSAGLEFPHWRITAFGDNLTDDQGVIASLVNGAIDTREGRTYGVRVGYRFQ